MLGCEPFGMSRKAASSLRILSLFCALLVVGSWPTTAEAQTQDASEEALAKLREGARLFDRGDYSAALAKFEAAYDQHPSPNLFYNIGMAFQRMNEPARAFESFESFLEQAHDASPQHREHAREELEKLAKKVALVTVVCDTSGATLSLDGRTVGEAPLSRRIPAETGPHDLKASHPDRGSTSRSFTTVAGEKVEVRLEFPPNLPATAMESPGDPQRLSTHMPAESGPRQSRATPWLVPARWATAGSSALALSLGVFFNVRSRAKVREFESFEGAMGPTFRCGVSNGSIFGGDACSRLASESNDLKRNAVIAYVTGGALAVASAVLFLAFDDGDSERTAAASSNFSIGPLGVSYARSF